MQFNDAILLAGKVLKEKLEQKNNKDNVEIAYSKKDDRKVAF